MDIIIPVLNEEKILRERADYYSSLKRQARIIFVDGGSHDKTVELAKNFGKVIISSRGRAHQMNEGAKLCQSSHILFLHVDTFLSQDTLENVDKVLQNGICGGCFTLSISDKRFIFRIFEKLVNLRARYFKVMDGDLGLFIKKRYFEDLNGFDEVPLMEDIFFSRKIRKAGTITVLPDKIFVSSRKWDEQGFMPTFIEYTAAYLRFWTGQIRGEKS